MTKCAVQCANRVRPDVRPAAAVAVSEINQLPLIQIDIPRPERSGVLSGLIDSGTEFADRPPEVLQALERQEFLESICYGPAVPRYNTSAKVQP
jgi:hypothetical protein